MKKQIQEKRFSFPLWNLHFNFKEQLILFYLVLLGLIVRIVNAIYTPLWRDEIYIFFIARDNSLWKLITQQHWDTAHPPLYSVFLHFWQMISIHPFWLRLPSLIASFFILYLIPILAIKITHKYKFFPFIFLFIFSLSHTQISLNMVARPYPFISLLTILSLINIINLYTKKNIQRTNLIHFIAINTINFSLDYSSIWLFITYALSLLIQFFYKQNYRKRILLIFKLLIIVNLILIPVYIHIYKNISQSFHLETETAIKFSALPKNNIFNGKLINFFVSQQKQDYSIKVKDGKKEILNLQNVHLSTKDKDRVLVGFNIPPFTGMILNKFEYCEGDVLNNCEKKKDILKKLRSSNTKSIVALYFGPRLIIYNFHPTGWKSFLFFPSSKKIARTFGLNCSFVSIGQNPSSQLLMSTGSDNNITYLDVNKLSSVISINNRNLNYEINLEAPPSHSQQKILESTSHLDRFGDDLLFLSSFPSYTNASFIWYSIFLIFISLIVLVIYFLKNNDFPILIILIMFFVPAIFSYIFSVIISPIFVMRNLYMSTYSFVVGVALLVSAGLLANKFSKIFILLFLGIYLVLFLIKFPFLHYTDPYYDINGIMKYIERNNSNKKNIILLSNLTYYVPPIKYYSLISPKKENKLIISTVELFKQVMAHKDFIYSKNKYVYYFLKFGYSERVNSNEFEVVRQYLNCNEKEVLFNYIYFAKCK